MTDQDHKLRGLLQLKKAETPGSAYFDAFLDEFHRYQQSEIPEQVVQPGIAGIFASWVDSFSFRPQALATLAGSAAVVALAGFLAVSQFTSSNSPVSVAGQTDSSPGYVVAPAVPASLISQPEELELASVSSFDKDFGSPRYVTGQTPGTYDSSIAF